MIPIIQVRKLRLNEVKQSARDFIVSVKAINWTRAPDTAVCAFDHVLTASPVK